MYLSVRFRYAERVATGTQLLTLEEFDRLYAHQDTAYEYWFGEAVQKGMPTWLHGLLQLILGDLFYKLGYAAASEIDLRTDPNWQPRPDVTAALKIEQPYQTRLDKSDLAGGASRFREFDFCPPEKVAVPTAYSVEANTTMPVL